MDTSARVAGWTSLPFLSQITPGIFITFAMLSVVPFPIVIKFAVFLPFLPSIGIAPFSSDVVCVVAAKSAIQIHRSLSNFIALGKSIPISKYSMCDLSSTATLACSFDCWFDFGQNFLGHLSLFSSLCQQSFALCPTLPQLLHVLLDFFFLLGHCLLVWPFLPQLWHLPLNAPSTTSSSSASPDE